MAEDPIVIEFGAKIDKLIEATARSNEAILKFKEHVDHVGESLKKIGELVGIAFTVEGIKLFVEHMAELGLATERSMATLGLTAEQTLQLGGLAKITGTSIEGLSLSIERMSLNIQRAGRDGLNPGAQALAVLGLRSKEFVGIPTSEYIEKLHDAVSKFRPSLELTNAVMQIGGRGVAQMIPLLQLSGERWQQMKVQINAAREGLAEAIPRMADTHAKITLLSLSTESLGARIFTVLKPAIDLVVTSLTGWMQKLDSKTIQDFTKALVDGLGRAIISMIGLFYEFGGTIDTLLWKMKLLLTGAGIGGAIGLLGGPGGAILGALGGAGLAAAFGQWTEQYNQGADKAKADVDKKKEELVGRVKSMMKSITDAISGGAGAGDHGPGGAAAGAINENAVAQFQALVASIEGRTKLMEGWLVQQKVIYQRDSDNWSISEQEKLSRTRDATNAEYEAVKSNLERIRDLYRSQGLVKEVAEQNAKILQLTQAHTTELLRINADMMRNYKAKFDEVFGALQSSFNGQLRGLLNGTITWAQAFKTVLGDMVIFFITMVEKMVFQWLAGKLAMVAADKTEATARVATEVAAAEGTLPLRIAKFTSDITANAALVFAGIFANLSPLLGPGAAGPAAAGEATVLAQLAAVPKFELGSDYVPYTGLAMVHEGEKIIPASENKGGGKSVNVSISAWDGASVAQWLTSGGATMLAKHISSAMNNNRSLRPKY